MSKVSVVLCAYNSGSQIRRTIESILSQTFTGFELIVIDDCSTDNTASIIAEFSDQRICFSRNTTNLGVVASRNLGQRLSQGEYIAHCDHDDVWRPEKLQRQVDYLDNNQAVGIVTTFISVYSDDQHARSDSRSVAYSSNHLKWCLYFNSTFLHSSIMVRRSVVEEHNISYAEGFDYADDWHIFHQYARVTELATLPELLTEYHYHGDNYSLQRQHEMHRNGAKVLQNAFEYCLDREVDTTLVEKYFGALNGKPCEDKATLVAVGALIRELYPVFVARYSLGEQDAHDIREYAANKWWKLSREASAKLGPFAIRTYSRSNMPGWINIPFTERWSTSLKALVKSAL